MVQYQQIRHKLNTGDLVLFAGRTRFSRWIMKITKSHWSHVGMVLRLPGWDMVLLWESSKLANLKDVLDRKTKRGVQIVSLTDRLKTYDGYAAVRFLKVRRTTLMMKSLMKLRQEIQDRPYETDKIQLFKAAYDGVLGRNERDLSSLFCSEMVAEAYKRMGLLPKGKRTLPSSEYTPKDFSSFGKRLRLKKRARLSKEVRISTK